MKTAILGLWKNVFVWIFMMFLYAIPIAIIDPAKDLALFLSALVVFIPVMIRAIILIRREDERTRRELLHIARETQRTKERIREILSLSIHLRRN